jgi:NADH-quinone oxidoreductase subunit M
MLTILLILLPFVAGSLLLAFKDEKMVKRAALGMSVAIFAATSIALALFSNTSLFTIDVMWIAAIGSHLHLGLDGISIAMVLLTTGLMPFIFSVNDGEIRRGKVFYALMFFAQGAILGVFTALDGFLFYIFWELSLIPIYFIILLWGGEGSRRTTLKFFIYTAAGSLLMLVAYIFIFMNSSTHSFDITGMYNQHISPGNQSWLFWMIFVAFAIKAPVFPLHTWMPETYTKAPMKGTMLLSAIMSKMGIYGMIRWMLPIVPLGSAQWGNTVMVLAIIGVVYASIITLKQKDLKTFSAYSSMAHIGLIVAGLFAFNLVGMQGVIFQMVAHGINIVGLLYIISIMETEGGSRLISSFGGLRSNTPRLSSLFMIITFGMVALPLTNAFIGEFLLITGIFKVSIWMAATAGLSIILGAIYMLYMFQKTMLGTAGPESAKIIDVKGCAFTALAIIALLIVVTGVMPQPILDVTSSAVDSILAYLNC